MTECELFYFLECSRYRKHLWCLKIQYEKSVKQLEFYFFAGKLGEAGERSGVVFAYFWGNNWKGMSLISISHRRLSKPGTGQKRSCAGADSAHEHCSTWAAKKRRELRGTSLSAARQPSAFAGFPFLLLSSDVTAEFHVFAATVI